MTERSSRSSPEIVVITGASAGVGRATVREFARRGAHIGLIARGEDGLRATWREVEKLGGKAIAIPCDVADFNAVDRAATRIEKELGPIDIWINDAFAGIFAEFLDMLPEEFERVTRVTYLGQVWGTLAALRRMVPRDRGSVVLVGSALVHRGLPLQSADSGAKHAIHGFHDSIRAELMQRDSRVNVSMVQLPAINTPQFDWTRVKVANVPKPAGAIYQPEVAAEAILFAAHAGRGEVLVGRPSVQPVWADRIASVLIDRVLALFGYSRARNTRPVEPDRPDNLFEPVPGDRGAHGRFDAHARSFSPELWLSMHRKEIGLGALALGAMGAGLLFALERHRR